MGRDHSCEVCGTGGFNSEHDWQRHAEAVEDRARGLERAVGQLGDERRHLKAALRRIADTPLDARGADRPQVVACAALEQIDEKGDGAR